MFDLVTGKARHLPRHSTQPIVLSTTAQALAGAAALVMPAFVAADRIPEIPTMLVFVAPLPPPLAPPQRPAAVRTVTPTQRMPSTPDIITPPETPLATFDLHLPLHL